MWFQSEVEIVDEKCAESQKTYKREIDNFMMCF